MYYANVCTYELACSIIIKLKLYIYDSLKGLVQGFISLLTTSDCHLSRAEGLAGEIKDLQGQLADYNMVHIYTN